VLKRITKSTAEAGVAIDAVASLVVPPSQW